jgi:hypothetical protein
VRAVGGAPESAEWRACRCWIRHGQSRQDETSSPLIQGRLPGLHVPELSGQALPRSSARLHWRLAHGDAPASAAEVLNRRARQHAMTPLAPTDCVTVSSG